MAEPPLTEDEEKLLDELAKIVVDRRLEVPAIFLLESFKPMGFIGSQAMVVLAPMVGLFYGGPRWTQVQQLLERRSAIEALIVRIEGAVE